MQPGTNLFKENLPVDICRCKVADVKMQVEITFLKLPAMSSKRNPPARNVDRQKLGQNCNVGLRWFSHDMRPVPALQNCNGVDGVA